jgi:hypothetical protein
MEKSFEIKGIKYYIPEISLKMYNDLRLILISPEKGDEFKIIEVVTGCLVDIQRKIAYADWNTIWNEVENKLLTLNSKTEDIRKTIEWNGTIWSLPDPNAMTIGEFVDLEIAFANESGDKLKSICSILYRPLVNGVLEEYSSDGYNARMEIFDGFPMMAVKSANSFFFHYADSLLKSTVESLLQLPETKELTQEQIEMLRKFQSQGLGGEQLISSLAPTLLDLTRLRGYRSDRPLTGLHGELTRTKKLSFWGRVKNKTKQIKEKQNGNTRS